MRAGKLRTRIDILTPPSAETPQDANGQPTAAWTTAATVWGSIEESGGSTSFTEDQFNTVKQVRITIRYYSGLTAKNRFSAGGRTFHILHIGGDLEKQIDMVCDCVEVET